MESIISISNLSKTYAPSGKKTQAHEALKNVSLDIKEGEIFALLGPNGAGKTTLISTICGLVNPTAGTISVGGFDIGDQYREARSLIGLVPQEISIDIFSTVWNSVRFSRGIFNLPPNDNYLEQVLKDLSLYDKRHNRLMALSGGMKRRVLIARALAHEPRVLFLDEPTAGVDVELRKDMWNVVRKLRESGTTIILTTHYIEEAEEMADRIGVIHHGKIILVEEKKELIKKLGTKQLLIDLQAPLQSIPESLAQHRLELTQGGKQIVYTYDTHENRTGITTLLDDLRDAGITFHDLDSKQSSLEEIFVDLVTSQ